MSITVTCSSGHTLRVKEKYAGKKGLCPVCKVAVDVPLPVVAVARVAAAAAAMSDSAISSLMRGAARDEPPAAHEDVLHHDGPSGSSVSLASSSFVRRHTKICPKCKKNVLAQYDLCPHCHTYFTNWSEIARRIAMRCPSCGAENPPGALQCDGCGQHLKQH